MENPVKMDDLGGYPYFLKQPYLSLSKHPHPFPVTLTLQVVLTPVCGKAAVNARKSSSEKARLRRSKNGSSLAIAEAGNGRDTGTKTRVMVHSLSTLPRKP